MQGLEHFSEIYLHREPVDMRKSINGLSVIVLEEMGERMTEGRLFVFMSRCRRRLKILYWDRTGFALWYKRLERERFYWSHGEEDEVIGVSTEELGRLLLGFDIFQKPHEYLRYEGIG
ncbi:IS66 family insertion sequence element accessory protein TnpB [Candidatus Magnetobacterium casense]|uniref:IS66 family insertion sequence element accessory protein TnpB n=1 Tax=Candidatus Magnetobacterium casense TaxID=1455061 RepID=A0ABS6S2H9_9BACT|nr:IS66 family insertion sequence element accessory protein TnpB [Candidatus Magnetobacterium casensis]MBV6343046.1 IS66 family insertion sequence element accessory protein TnpB [Candidatus Magnetobacterium casensis]